jgi:hypothetical protein
MRWPRSKKQQQLPFRLIYTDLLPVCLTDGICYLSGTGHLELVGRKNGRKEGRKENGRAHVMQHATTAIGRRRACMGHSRFKASSDRFFQLDRH